MLQAERTRSHFQKQPSRAMQFSVSPLWDDEVVVAVIFALINGPFLLMATKKKGQ
jgi:hypothetical protein